MVFHEDDDNKTQEEASDEERDDRHNLTSFLASNSNGGMKPVEFTNSIGQYFKDTQASTNTEEQHVGSLNRIST